MMHIALCFDDHYATYASATMASVMDNNKEEKICFHVITDSLSEENEQILTRWMSGTPNSLKVYRVDGKLFDDFPIDGYINISTYFRLLLPQLLPDIDKVLYLDCDVAVCGSLQELWKTDLTDYALAGVRDRINDSIRLYNRLRYPLQDGYVNAGVLLINLKRWRGDRLFDAAKRLAEERRDALKNHDQDIINTLYHGQIKMLPFKYNLLEYYLYVEDWLHLDRKYYAEVIEACNNPVIVHFCMPVKPWHFECINPYQDLYLKYRAMTPWPDLPLTHRKQHHSKKDRLKLFLEKLGLYHVERKATLRKDINVIEDSSNILF